MPAIEVRHLGDLPFLHSATIESQVNADQFRRGQHIRDFLFQLSAIRKERNRLDFSDALDETASGHVRTF